MSQYEHVGPRVEYGDVRISAIEANDFRRIALLGSKITKIAMDDNSSSVWAVSYATGALSDYWGDYAVPESAILSKSSAGPEPGYWRSAMHLTRYSLKHANVRIHNTFEVQSKDGEVTRAVRSVRVLQAFTRVTFDESRDDFISEVHDKKYKSYEVPMEAEDIPMLGEKLDRLMNRQRVTGAMYRAPLMLPGSDGLDMISRE